MRVKIKLPGCPLMHVEDVSLIPAIGTVVQIDRTMTATGSPISVRITEHEWRLVDAALEEAHSVPEFEVTLTTVEVD